MKEIKINLDGIEYIDSSALGLLLELRESARVTGKTVSLTGAYGIVRQTLKVANFDKLFLLN
ncbi:MAG: STAS domain-containing protein [Betaproteobacteria bacterium]|nr:STAS domain-containing protein [Betaproteobacteria bacterium]